MAGYEITELRIGKETKAADVTFTLPDGRTVKRTASWPRGVTTTEITIALDALYVEIRDGGPAAADPAADLVGIPRTLEG